MRINPRDGRCRSCDGELEITDTDDATMTVECTQCGDEYQVEPDAFGDGAQDYYTEMRCRQLFEAETTPLTLPDFLTHLKLGEPVLMAPWEGSKELIPCVAQTEPGTILEIDEETFFYYLEMLPPRFQRGGEFCFAEGSGPFLYFWKSSKDVYYARPLSDEETDTFCRLTKVSRYL